MKKQEVLTWRNALLKQDKYYIDKNLNLAKVNVTKVNLPLSVREILDQLETLLDYSYRVFSISKDEDLGLHLKREANLCFVNNYLEVGLKA